MASGAGVVQKSSCCDAFSCVSTTQRTQGVLSGRCCPHWRMAPGVLALAALVVATVYALIWNNPYVCIAYAPGGIGTAYLIFMGWDFEHLKSFGENNTQLSGNVQRLEKDITALETTKTQLEQDLKGQINNLTTENKSLKDTAAQLENVVKTISSEKENLEKAKKELEETIDTLNKTKTKLETEATLHVQQLHHLQTTLNTLHASVVQDRSKSSQHLTTLETVLGGLQTTSKELKEGSEKVDKQQQAQVEMYVEIAKTAKTTIDEIIRLRNIETTEAAQERSKLLASVEATHRKNEADFKIQLVQLEGQVNALKAQEDIQKKHLEDLGKIEEDFKKQFSTLLESIKELNARNDELKSTHKELADLVSKAADAFEKFSLKDKLKPHKST